MCKGGRGWGAGGGGGGGGVEGARVGGGGGRGVGADPPRGAPGPAVTTAEEPAAPTEVDSDDEVAAALASGEWKEVTDKKTGKPYFHHPATKKTAWNLKKELKKQRADTAPAAAVAPDEPVAVEAVAEPVAAEEPVSSTPEPAAVDELAVPALTSG